MIPPIPTNKKIPIFRPEERSLELDLVRRNNVKGGVSTGFERLDPFFTVKRGFPLFIAGAPHHGKSQFVKQLLVNLSKIHGYRHAIYLGEEGSIEDIVIELAEIYTGKKILLHDDRGNKIEDALPEEEFQEVQRWINKHFWIISPDDADIGSFDVRIFYQWVDAYEKEYEMKFDTTVIDPWNDLSMNLNSQGGREDLFLADALKHVRDQSRQRHRTDIIITHISAPYAKHRSQKGVRFASPAEPYEIAGGQTWYRRAFTMILVYRPPSPDQLKFGKVLIDTNAGETWLVIQKSKPKGVGKLGRVTLYYNKKTNNYQEETLDEDEQ